MFRIKRIAGCKVIELFSDPITHKIASSFVLVSKNQSVPEEIKNAIIVEVPVQKVACLGSLYVAMFTMLGSQNVISAIDNIDYYTDSWIRARVNENKVVEISKGPELDIEHCIEVHPNLIFNTAGSNAMSVKNQKLMKSGIITASASDNLESHPLARAEWIKFFAAFVGKEVLADSLFELTKQNYLTLKKMTDSCQIKPSVFTEIKFGDAWYVPGGNSFMAALLKDAGAHYLWEETTVAGSIPLSFEIVYRKARDADFWFNLFMVNSKTELLGFDQRYRLFRAFQTEHLYNNNKIRNAKGFSAYWEEGICHPDQILSDLIAIVHPGIMPSHKLKYYQKIQ
jgi:iron complex transport system substrate-binding protein